MESAESAVLHRVIEEDYDEAKSLLKGFHRGEHQRLLASLEELEDLISDALLHHRHVV